MMNTTTAGILAVLGLAAASPFMAGTHAHADDGDAKTVGKWAIGKAAAPSDEVGPAINAARADLCSDDQPSVECGVGAAVLDATEITLKATEARTMAFVTLAVIGAAAPAAIAICRKLGSY